MAKVGAPPKYLINGKAKYGIYQHYCVDCEAKIYRGSQRCRSCSKKGYKQTEEHRRKIAEQKVGPKNPNWKGKSIGYSGLHSWIRRNFTKSKACEKCGKEGFLDWANKTGKYLRSREDWILLCRSCHMKYDYKNKMRVWKKNGAV